MTAAMVTGTGAGIGAAAKAVGSQGPIGRIAEADGIAQWIKLRATPDSGRLTGAAIPFDGGQTPDIS